MILATLWGMHLTPPDNCRSRVVSIRKPQVPLAVLQARRVVRKARSLHRRIAAQHALEWASWTSATNKGELR